MNNYDLIEDIEPPKKSKKKIVGGLILGAIPLLFIIYLVLGPLLHILSKDLSAEEMYVISEWVNVRATSDLNSLKMGKVDYGTKLLVYDFDLDPEWAEVLIDGQKGYVSKQFIVKPEVYFTIQGIAGDKRSERLISNTKYRLALYRYFESKGYTSDIPADIRSNISKSEIEKPIFQLFSERSGLRYNSTVFADFDGDFREDAAFVLKNKLTDQKLLVIFSFDKNDPLNISKVIYEQELENPWYFIHLAGKGYRYYTDDKEKKTKLPINGILIGSNRDKKLNDPVFLLLYNGESFDTLEQPKN